MNSGEFLSINPPELQFTFELNKQICCTMQLTNHTDNFIAFKVKTTNPKKYSVRPNTGIVLPNSKHDILVTMQAQKEAPADMQCKDKFLLQSVITNAETTVKDITSDMFNKESGYVVDEKKLKVSYVAPQQPSLVEQEDSDEDSVSDNNKLYDSSSVSRPSVDLEDDTHQDNSAIISRLMEEKNSALQTSKKIHQEMNLQRLKSLKSTKTEPSMAPPKQYQGSYVMNTTEHLRREISQKRAAIPYFYVLLVGFIGILTGYIMKRI